MSDKNALYCTRCDMKVYGRRGYECYSLACDCSGYSPSAEGVDDVPDYWREYTDLGDIDGFDIDIDFDSASGPQNRYDYRPICQYCRTDETVTVTFEAVDTIPGYSIKATFECSNDAHPLYEYGVATAYYDPENELFTIAPLPEELEDEDDG